MNLIIISKIVFKNVFSGLFYNTLFDIELFSEVANNERPLSVLRNTKIQRI